MPWKRRGGTRLSIFRACSARVYRLVLFLLLVLPALTAWGEPLPKESPLRWKVSGYVKTQNSISVDDLPWQDTPADHSMETDSLNRLRLRNSLTRKISDSQEFLAILDLDAEPQFSSDLSSGSQRMRTYLIEQRQYFDLVKTFDVNGDAEFSQSIYRGYLMYRGSDLSAAVGRQQIPWGVTYFFTPTDVFNPIFPTQLDWDERPGVDALWIERKLESASSIEFIYTPPGRDLHPERYMTRASREFDFIELGVLGGWVDQELTGGVDLRATLGDSALRSECLQSALPDGEAFERCSVNADHNFPGNVYTSLEFHYNGPGAETKSGYNAGQLYGGGILPLARDYLAMLFGHDVTPLVHLEFSQIMNLVDSSSYLRPQGRWSVTDNTTVTAGALLYTGGKTDEFGLPGDVYFVEGQYSF